LEIIRNIDSTTCIPTFDADVRAVAALVASVVNVFARSTGVSAPNRFVVAIAFALFRIAASLKNISAFSSIKVILVADVMLFLSSVNITIKK
jgi:hypothetical protein